MENDFSPKNSSFLKEASLLPLLEDSFDSKLHFSRSLAAFFFFSLDPFFSQQQDPISASIP